MISNLYTWIFPAAMFTAAGLRNLTSSVKRKRNPAKARRNRVVWFSLNISIAFCFLAGSVFFVDWDGIVWSVLYLYFSLAVLGIFYFGFVFRYIIGLPLVFAFTLVVLFFNIYLQGWTELPVGGDIGQYRLLSNEHSFNEHSGVKAEVTITGAVPVFIQGEGSVLSLNFEVLQFNKILFFISSDIYYRMTNLIPEPGFSDLIINYLVEKSFLISGKTYSVSIEDKALLYQYRIILDKNKKKSL